MNGNRSDEELRKLAKTWFSDARQKSAQEETEVAAWYDARRKWTPLGYHGGSRSSDCDSDGGGGDCGGGGE